MVHIFNPSAWEAEAGQPGVQGQFQVSKISSQNKNKNHDELAEK